MLVTTDLVDYYAPAIVGLVFLYFLRNKFRRHLYSIPGPKLAGFSNLWRFADASFAKQHETQLRLHEKYQSPVVRIGPKVVSVSDPEYIPTIYGLKSGFTKTAFYTLFMLPHHGEFTPSLFTTLSEDYHAQYKRPIASSYSMSTLVEFEPLVDSTTELFLQRIGEFADSKEELDLGTWLQMYAFDVVGEIVFGQKLGFLETRSDVQGIMADIRFKIAYASIIGQMPWLDKLITKNPLVLMFIDTHPIVKFTIERMKERLDPNIGFVPAHRDFLSRSFESKEKYPDLVTDRIVRMWNIDNVFAGSDTTAIALRSIIYHLLRNPETMEKLQNEIDSQSVANEGKLFTWATANKMPYLTAVIKEGLRMHPAVGQLLERHVPKDGVTIGGHFLPEGTIVGMNPWVAARNKSVYGVDANCFRPERWLEASLEEQSLMERTNLAFGHGARTCVGKNISLLEIHKLIPELLRQFKFSFSDPEKDWNVHGGWFTEQDGLIVNIQRRSLDS